MIFSIFERIIDTLIPHNVIIQDLKYILNKLVLRITISEGKLIIWAMWPNSNQRGLLIIQIIDNSANDKHKMSD